MITLYLNYCRGCKKETKQFISKVSRRRGVKLTCASCGKESKTYTTKNLTEYSRPNVDSAGTLGSSCGTNLPEIKTAFQSEKELKQ
jgi:hypothetical protein